MWVAASRRSEAAIVVVMVAVLTVGVLMGALVAVGTEPTCCAGLARPDADGILGYVLVAGTA